MTPKGFDHSGCRYYEKNHPDYNYANVTWADSPQGKIYATCGKKTLAPMLMIHNGIVVNKGMVYPLIQNWIVSYREMILMQNKY